MFSVIIKGRTMMELRTNLSVFLAGMDDFTVPSPVSQETEISYDQEELGPAGYPVEPEQPFTMPHIPAHIAQAIIPEPARSISTPPPPVPVTVPTTAPSVATPIAPAGTAVSNEFGLDSNGLPWDARIHAVTQGVNKDGSWRYRRGVEMPFIKQVEAELRTNHPVVASPQVSDPHPAPQAVPPPVVASPAPAPAVVPPLRADPPVNLSAHSFETFKANLPMTLTKLVTDGKLPQAYIQSLKEYFKVEQIWQVNDAQALEMFNTFVEAGVLVKV